MKTFYAFIAICFFLSSCSGISEKDKETMRVTLENELCNRYLDANYPIMFLRVELLKIYKERTTCTSGKFSAGFKCMFEENGQNITLFGHAEFEEVWKISPLPKYMGDNKIAIYLSSPYIVDSKYYSRLPATSKYILDCFENRNKILENE